jgi:hypothetical protein
MKPAEQVSLGISVMKCLCSVEIQSPADMLAEHGNSV